MISEFTLRPKAQNKRAPYIIAALLFGAAAFFLLYLVMQVYRGVVGLVSLGFITAAVFIYTKYVAPEYYYDIMVANNTPLFVVRQLTGKRFVTLSRVELGSITAVCKLTSAERRAHKTPQGYMKYSYTPTIGPEVVYMITVVSRYERAEIVIEANDEFAALLLSYAKEAKESYNDEE